MYTRTIEIDYESMLLCSQNPKCVIRTKMQDKQTTSKKVRTTKEPIVGFENPSTKKFKKKDIKIKTENAFDFNNDPEFRAGLS